MDVFNFLGIASTDEQGKSLTVKVMKNCLLTNLETNQLDKKKLDSFESTGKSISEVRYDFVIQTIWLHKPPKCWPPSKYQIENMFGRAVLAIMLFSLPSSFPAKPSLGNFGYLVQNELKLNLNPSLQKEKNVRLLLASLFKKKNSKRVRSVKRKRLGVRRVVKKNQIMPTRLIE